MSTSSRASRAHLPDPRGARVHVPFFDTDGPGGCSSCLVWTRRKKMRDHERARAYMGRYGVELNRIPPARDQSS
ncbi:unnamed protein product [Protopolystoma xenopodis]|uniref:Uncharacterized protein n=1 Tax=Protopolystoma xenopodis TaxID=117903 RepID=A0A448XPR6_9PLAT|nr:unnamed protein product [Protopolystoma xenopodis]